MTGLFKANFYINILLHSIEIISFSTTFFIYKCQIFSESFSSTALLILQIKREHRAVARTLIGGGGGGCLFIYSCSARLVSFQIDKFEFDFKRN